MSATVVDDGILPRDASWNDAEYAEALEAQHGWSPEKAEAHLLTLEEQDVTDPLTWENRSEHHEGARAKVCLHVAEVLKGGADIEQIIGGDSKAAESTVAPDQIVLAGAWDLDKVKADGKRPTGAVLKLKAGKLVVDGSFKKGETVRMLVTARVVSAAPVDKLDPTTKQVTDCEVQHTVVLTDARVVE